MQRVGSTRTNTDASDANHRPQTTRRIESVLWVGSATEMSHWGVAAIAELDLTWVPGVDEALALAPMREGAVVVCAREPERDAARIRRLAGAFGSAPLVALLDRSSPSLAGALHGAGATAVLTREGLGGAHEGRRLLAALRGARDAVVKPRREPVALTPGLIGDGTAMQAVVSLATRAAASATTVLLTGETGTGKEVVARAIHTEGRRSAGPFLAVNCAAFPDTLLESELFGYVKGSFTGAERDRAGLFEQAAGGTLFLDEIGETAPPLQAKLLRVLQEREVRRLGEGRSRPIDVRLVAATNRNLQEEARHGRFREDLYYRLAVFPIPLPALRERREDIPALLDHFLALHGRGESKQHCRFTLEAENLLLSHTWPGNVRELENEVQRALALAEPGQPLGVEMLSDRVAGILEPISASSRPGESLRECMDRVEAWYIRHQLALHDGRKAATARTLGVTREGLYKKMKRLGIG